MHQPIEACGFMVGGDVLPVKFIKSAAIAQQFGFQQKPR
jgi:hypothetical protein